MTAQAPAAPSDSEAIVDERPRSRRLVAPVVTAVVVLAATTYIRFVDPNVPGRYPVCPTKLLLGIDCPGCGGLRATHDLACGDIAGAFDNNALFVILVPFLLAGWGVWMYRAWTGKSPAPTPRRTRLASVLPWVVICLGLGFMIVRNLVPYLRSGVG